MRRRTTTRRLALLGLVAAGLLAAPAAYGIPVFAKIYGQPCSACHTIYPQLNPAGEAFRAHGLHGLTPAVKPLRVAPGVEIPGTLPVAASLGFGEDVIRVDAPGKAASTTSHFNLNYLSVLAGGELGPHLAFLGDYAPLFANTRSGDLITNTRVGLAFLQAHGTLGGWLLNLRAGVFELPLVSSPRVHRLTQQSYLVYSLTSVSMLGAPPANLRDPETLTLGATQLGGELSGLHSASGVGWSLGVIDGSNNRPDNNAAKDVYARVAKGFGLHSAGLFFYYSPDVFARGVHDSAVRVGPDLQLRTRQLGLRAQFLASFDSNPTGSGRDLWYYGTFVDGEYRIFSTLAAVTRGELAWMPHFDDSGASGANLRRRIWQVTGGVQWLVRENVKLVLETTYNVNHESVADRSVGTWSTTLRLATAFWILTPTGFESWADPQ